MIYVDDLMQHGTPGRYRGELAAQAERVGARNGHRWCHLYADSLEELHAFAERLGMKRAWFQLSRSGVPHYDLTPERRALAVRLGATEVNRAEALALRRAFRVWAESMIRTFGRDNEWVRVHVLGRFVR